ncbi:aspartyl-tRNA synthetase [Byssothecium circinans]|uniref:Aspartyl-tRNA synthetase n=1 Tax=Byssothecium circinans TaxID=147558 RepID=A0A6A5U291_9PLEO|nr:aspartyl-tRNA synthetase [Byssothecium circinans]KAF1959031.1 aspartyl-tRNA synthetase [Byssothecium circinans]
MWAWQGLSFRSGEAWREQFCTLHLSICIKSRALGDYELVTGSAAGGAVQFGSGKVTSGPNTFIVDSSPWDNDFQLFTNGLNKRPLGQEVILRGYLTTRRDVNKKLSFAIIRSEIQSMSIQLVSSANEEGSPAAEAHARLRTLRDWTPVVIKGILQEKAPPKENSKPDPQESDQQEKKPSKNSNAESSAAECPMISGREIALTSVLPLNEIALDVIIKEEAAYGPEQRHLQLRTSPQLRENLLLRHRVNSRARTFLNERSWKEVETPLLFKSTPEGAREFLVPTRNKGLAYALPQSPQQYKQILMASGLNRYYQFAKCFRDEDLRADRQPEFTQLDLEMSFAGEDKVMAEVESLLQHLWNKELGMKLRPFARLTYQEAMSSYGSDKPDLRYTSRIHQITSMLPPDLISKITPLETPTVDALRLHLSPEPSKNRKFIADFLESPEGKPYLSNPDGQPAAFIGDASQPLSGLGALGPVFAMDCPPEVAIDHGDVLILQARPNTPFQGQGSTMLGNLRTALYKAATDQDLLLPSHRPNKHRVEFVWITDFPLFTPSTASEPGQGGQAGLSSTHHPFTAPKTAADVDLLLTDPTKAVAAHYDIVVNGVELGGGSRRIHNAAVQKFIFRDVLKMKEERVEDFRHLLDVLASGCPPHAGLALGWDRLCAVMAKTESVRDVIAFPKTGRGEDPLVRAPNRASEEQWGTYHLRVEE